MAINSVLQTIRNAEIDARSLSEFIYSPADAMVSRRLAPSIHTLQYYVNRFETIDSSFTQALNTANAAAVTATNNAVGLIDNVTNQASQSVQNAIQGVAIDANLVTDALTTVVPLTMEPTSNYRTQLNKNREHVSISDFFTAEEAAIYADNWKTLDASRAIQEFFDYIAVVNVGTADASGDYYIGSGLELNGARRPVAGAQQLATMTIVGTLRLYARNAIDTMLKLYNCAELRWLGSIYVQGRAVGLSHTSRTCRLGVHISRSNGAQFGGFKCDYFRSFGISLDDSIGNTSSMSLGKIFCRVCGSGARNASLVANYSAREDITVVGSPSRQRSKLKVDVLPNPEDISGNYRKQYFMRVAGKTYRIMETDYENSIVSVYPIITENTDQTGTFDYVFGGGVNIRGGDSGVHSFDTIVGQNCGIVVDMCSLYGPEITNMVAESNGIAIAVGLNIDSAMVSYNIGGFYMEGNQCDIFQHTEAYNDGGYFIGAEYALNLAKIEGSMRLYSIMKNGRLLNYEKRAKNLSEYYALDISIDRPNLIHTYRKDTGRVRITPVGTELNRLFGYDSATIVLQGTGENGEPTGEYTFESRDSTWTVNGSTQPITLSGFSGTAVVCVYCNLSTKNITVTLANPAARKQTQSVAATTVLANSKFVQTVNVTGASLGNWVQAAYTQPTAGLLTNAYVSAANAVTVEFINPTASPIALAAGSIKIKLTKL